MPARGREWVPGWVQGRGPVWGLARERVQELARVRVRVTAQGMGMGLV